MLVKSLTDGLAWKVQRELVNNYFREKRLTQSTDNLFSDIKRKEIEARYNNSLARRARELRRIADAPTTPEEYRQVLNSKAVEILTGYPLLPLPEAERKTYTADEIGKKLNPQLSANKVGRLTNAHNLKTEQYGKLFYDKSPHSCKEIESFRYFENIVPKLQSIISAVHS